MLWLNWATVVGGLSLLVMISLCIRPVFVALTAFALQIFYFLTVRRGQNRRDGICRLLPYVASAVMLWTGLIMLCVCFLYSHWMIARVFDMASINTEIPFITVLIVSPVAFAVTAVAYHRGDSLAFCCNCTNRYGTHGERGFMGQLFRRESRYQLRLLRDIAAIITLAGWVYYFIEYSNDRLNELDRYIFFWAPLAMFLASLLYMTLRYGGLWNYYSLDSNVPNSGAGPATMIRYIIICDNYMMLRLPLDDPDRESTPGRGRYDTPARVILPHRATVTLQEARSYFLNMAGLDDADVRPMYVNADGDPDYNVFHFLVFLTPEQTERVLHAHPEARLYTMREVTDLINTGRLTMMMSAEVMRLHTVAMAWKTYDDQGHRLYRIKHYQPTFRLRDVQRWDVDYNDARWLRVAQLNEDSPLFGLRRWWGRVFTGSGF